MFIEEYRLYRGYEFTYDKSRLSEFHAQIQSHIRYNPKADPWDNTILYGGISNFFPTELIALPAGIGLRIIIVPQNLRFPVHSRYILLDNTYYFDWFKQKERLFLLAQTSIGRLYYCLHENEPAINGEGILKGDLNNPDLTCWLGDIYMGWGQTDYAIQYFQKSLDHNPNTYNAIFRLALCYARKGDYEKSRLLFERAIKNNPDIPEPYYNIACIYAKSDKTDESIAWLKKSIEKGFHNWKLLKTDSDLDRIRDTDFYQQLLKDLGNR
jgi:tetratricopeptide (TPR) repeat protein